MAKVNVFERRFDHIDLQFQTQPSSAAVYGPLITCIGFVFCESSFDGMQLDEFVVAREPLILGIPLAGDPVPSSKVMNSVSKSCSTPKGLI